MLKAAPNKIRFIIGWYIVKGDKCNGIGMWSTLNDARGR